MKRSSKLRGMILVGLLSLALAGCGNQTQETEAESKVQEQVESTEGTEGVKEAQTVEDTKVVKTVTEAETQEETQEETVQTPPVELAAGFDEEFVLKPGEILYVGREGIRISLDKIEYDEYGTLFVYILGIDGKEITGFGFAGIEVDNQISQDEFTENRVCCIGAEEDKSVTLMITSGTEIPAPLVLSGNASDKYVTTKPEYVENDKMILFLAEGVKVYGNTMELLEKLVAIAEKESGLYMDNDTPFAERSGNSTDWLYGQETFPGVDPTGEKFHVYVVSHDVCTPCALGSGVVLNPQDLEIEAGAGDVMLHETLHCLQMLNGVQMDSIMDEGFATYMTGRICDKDEEMNFNFDATMNYSYYDRKITKENAEEIFCEVKEDNWEDYLYGFRFITYLYETYGEDIFVKILKDASPQDTIAYAGLSAKEVVAYIKGNTSDTVFEDFAVWLEKNKSRFSGN